MTLLYIADITLLYTRVRISKLLYAGYLTHDVHDIQNKMEKRVKLQPFRN